jgi:hypothetical protein
VAARRKMIEIARRRHARGAGSDLLGLMTLRRSPLSVNLDELFAGIPYVVVGGVATRSYMPERFTKDVDVLVAGNSYEVSVSRMRGVGWHAERELRLGDSSLGLRGTLLKRGDLELDLITSDAPWATEACALPVLDTGIRVIALPYLILMKLDSARPQDTADISRMLALAGEKTVAQARDVVCRYARDSESVEDFESLLEIGRWELEGEKEH